ncbi:hypothetical protein SORDD30_01765 [Streptococcus oralis]|uniref:Uncharacterized protein n=1 Tax=Streptococcus oralis TaxID=1303 RepID=A0A139Q3I6_STROR|nr:hypothetical protein SORDD30_01765 [Streptococcus oralis]
MSKFTSCLYLWEATFPLYQTEKIGEHENGKETLPSLKLDGK